MWMWMGMGRQGSGVLRVMGGLKSTLGKARWDDWMEW